MSYKSSTVNISKIIINDQYSISGKKYCLNNSNEVESIDIDIASLSNIRLLSNLAKIKTVKEYFPVVFSILNINTIINYSKILGNIKSKEYFNYLNEEIKATLPLITTYHTEIFPLRKKCYINLDSVYLDGEELDIPVYDHSGVTGRTKIKSGFNFLTLKKELRKNITIKDRNYKVAEIDFKSCEPFFYLKSQGFEIEGDDVYKWVAKKYNIDIRDRDKVKRGILSMIYGANEYTTAKIMRISEEKINKIKDDLGINSLKTRLEAEYAQKGFILNYYGRPITSDNNLVNYWIQSSTVDYCSLAFNEFNKIFKTKPLFYIHDSMTFKVENKRIEEVLSVKSIKEPLSKITIPVEHSTLA